MGKQLRDRNMPATSPPQEPIKDARKGAVAGAGARAEAGTGAGGAGGGVAGRAQEGDKDTSSHLDLSKMKHTLPALDFAEITDEESPSSRKPVLWGPTQRELDEDRKGALDLVAKS